MPRPIKRRVVSCEPKANFFKPVGVQLQNIELVVMTLDEMEAIRLADYLGLYQEDAAAAMGVSRQTFGNIVASARKKMADAIINGKAIKIEGGIVNYVSGNSLCKRCGFKWSNSSGEENHTVCPNCKKDI
ncbi:DUF134 domain-containing protein [Calditerrivibrio nitroreducens]|uniref:UPF0251 protein Calni_1906 n=1 Tax=Calditerrivibrio nitroreducens (strain DSM 19672 / NBRC 101217 / Yu37-1) TaxID=768670 RepID=E4TH12_CALNY|nr:DUF134 domain-containing protein [Calditerrivibrio nitroreducens]ADR19810.1 protein of unknown function DUF134 [Calditerrivibrio nitroreducens DSM 19672]